MERTDIDVPTRLGDLAVTVTGTGEPILLWPSLLMDRTLWGAMIGGTFAALHPERAGCVVLMNGTASPAPLAQKLQYAALLLVAKLLRGIRPPLTGSVVRAFLGPNTRRTRPDVVRKVLDIAVRNDVESASWAIRSRGHHVPVSEVPDRVNLLVNEFLATNR